MDISCSKDISASAEKVWSIMTDLEGFPDTIGGIENVERLDGADGFEVGTTWRETRIMFGRTATEDMWVTELDPGHSYVVEANSHGAEYRTTQSVAPAGDGGSVLSMSFSANPTGTMAKVMSATVGRFFVNATRKAFEQDLADIAAAAEGSS
jgi:carbon monoxide dehydrogenase subunit G